MDGDMVRAPSVQPLRYLSELLFRSTDQRAEAQHFAVRIVHAIFSAMPVLEGTSSGISRSRRQLAGL
jgi:hypothetical protein